MRGAQVSAYVVSAQSGAVVYERNADAAMIPASTLKLVVGSAAIDELGSAFAFTTTLATDGTALYLHGGGDPLLRTADFDGAARELAAQRQTTFSMLVGDVGAASVLPYPDGWQIDDLPYAYAAPPSALSVAENTLTIKLHPAAPGEPATFTVDPQTTAMTILNHVVTGPPKSDDTTEATLLWDQPDTIVISGTLPADETDGEIDAAMLDPARVTLALATDALARGGIVFAHEAHLGATPAGARVLWTHRSQTLPDLLRAMWQPSDNLLAESLLDALADSRDAALARERAWLQSIGVDPATVTLVDGSGLSPYDRITPRDLVAILAHDWNGPNREIVTNALPVAGKSGTLADRFASAPLLANVIAKTGTVSHARALAGYLQTPHGPLIFALLINNWMDTSPQASADVQAFQAAFLETFFQ